MRARAFAGALALAAGTAASAAWAAGDALLASRLLDAGIESPSGASLGEVEDLLIGPDGRALALRIEGDAEYYVPWDVLTDADTGELAIPLALEGEPGVEDLEFGEPGLDGVWSASLLVGVPVAEEGERPFGIVEDLVLDRAGRLRAVLIAPQGGVGGPYLAAWGEVAFEPTLGYLTLHAPRAALRPVSPVEADAIAGGLGLD